MRRFVITPRAADEIEIAAAWYEASQPGLGYRFEAAVGKSIEQACEHPTAFPSIAETLRRVITRPFKNAIVFETEDDRIIVIAVVDLRQDPQTIETRLREEP